MTKKMLIDATHPEETRVAIVSGNKLEEYDYENVARKQLKSNIYLVKVTRVEPSLQAAFVDFGGNRHGFLPFPEIHPDYYRIPIADREALIAEERAYAAAQAAREEAEDAAELAAQGHSLEDLEAETGEDDDAEEEMNNVEEAVDPEEEPFVPQPAGSLAEEIGAAEIVDDEESEEDTDEEAAADTAAPEAHEASESGQDEEEADVDSVGGDTAEMPVFRSSLKKKYKIQEVIKRNQIMLIQISKEERGNKGAAVTSYISLPGRYCVLMPNSPRGGGVSRKVSSAKDRHRLKKILQELDVPEGMSVILRTAGVSRSHAEIKRDLDYLLRLWDQIRELTLKSTAPALIYEEGNLIKRAIRDLYRRDIEEVHVAGEDSFKAAKDFMKTLMPSHADRVQLYQDEMNPLFSRFQVEKQIDEIHSPTVHLKSGGYIVINPTEAMVSIDVNSGRATKGRHIEETALKTNIEAAEEIARQLRLRDQGGLVVIDFIDMEDRRGNRIVERKLRDAMSGDRARIQLGRISAFGLLELSRQRLHPSLVETNFETCKHCNGTGMVRTVETAAVMLLRAIVDEGMRARASEIRVSVAGEVALYVFNHKREMLADIERRHNLRVYINADDSLITPAYKIEALRPSAISNRPQRPAPVQSVDISDLPEVPESEITDDSTMADDENFDNDRGSRDFGDDENRGGERRSRGGRNRRRRGGRDRDGERGGDRNGDRNGRQNNRPQNNESGNIQDVGGQEGDFAAEGSDQGQNDQGQGGQNQNGREGGREGGRRSRGGRNRRRRGGRDRNGDRGGDRGGERRQGQGGESIPGMGPQPAIGDHSPAAPDMGGPRAEPAYRNDSSSAANESMPDDGEGGNRKGWWKRLTE